MPMFYRVDLNIVHMVCKMPVVVNKMFSEATLPGATFALGSDIFCLDVLVGIEWHETIIDVEQMKCAQPAGYF